MERDRFVSELMGCQSATLSEEMACCKRIFSMALPSGYRIRDSGFSHFRFHDGTNPPILDLRYNSACCEMPSFTVQLGDSPPLKISKKGSFTTSVLVYDEHGDPVLRIRRSAIFTPEYKITNLNRDVELGYIKTHFWESDVTFPPDLEVRYKAALLVAPIYIDYISRRRN